MLTVVVLATTPEGHSAAMVLSNPPTGEDVARLALLGAQPGLRAAAEWSARPGSRRCRYTISPGFYHQEQPQPEGASHVVCSLRRARDMVMRGPLFEVLEAYLDDAAEAKS